VIELKNNSSKISLYSSLNNDRSLIFKAKNSACFERHMTENFQNTVSSVSTFVTNSSDAGTISTRPRKSPC